MLLRSALREEVCSGEQAREEECGGEGRGSTEDGGHRWCGSATVVVRISRLLGGAAVG